MPTRVIDTKLEVIQIAARDCVAQVMGTDYRKASMYLEPTLVVSACRRHRKAGACMEILVKIGRPNAQQRSWIAERRGIGFEPGAMQLHSWPDQKKRRKA